MCNCIVQPKTTKTARASQHPSGPTWFLKLCCFCFLLCFLRVFGMVVRYVLWNVWFFGFGGLCLISQFGLGLVLCSVLPCLRFWFCLWCFVFSSSFPFRFLFASSLLPLCFTRRRRRRRRITIRRRRRRNSSRRARSKKSRRRRRTKGRIT